MTPGDPCRMRARGGSIGGNRPTVRKSLLCRESNRYILWTCAERVRRGFAAGGGRHRRGIASDGDQTLVHAKAVPCEPPSLRARTAGRFCRAGPLFSVYALTLGDSKAAGYATRPDNPQVIPEAPKFTFSSGLPRRQRYDITGRRRRDRAHSAASPLPPRLWTRGTLAKWQPREPISAQRRAAMVRSAQAREARQARRLHGQPPSAKRQECRRP
jgi:hypothetical protein